MNNNNNNNNSTEQPDHTTERMEQNDNNEEAESNAKVPTGQPKKEDEPKPKPKKEAVVVVVVENGEKCCLCSESLYMYAADLRSRETSQFTRMTCCGKGMHDHCAADLLKTMKMTGTACPLCRTKTPTTLKQEIKRLRPWLKKKKAWAQLMMGQKYHRGNSGVKRSFEMAKKLFELAAQQGDAGATFAVGQMYFRGQGVEQSYDRSFEYYERAAHLGIAIAVLKVGQMCDQGLGAEQSIDRAKECYELAIEQLSHAQLKSANNKTENAGAAKMKHYYAEAMFCLGCLYADGRGVERDVARTKELLAKAAALEHQAATNYLRYFHNKEKEAAALDPNAVVCSMCGFPETETRTFSKTKCPCKSAWYCNTTCQKEHWNMHKYDCKRLMAEMKREKIEKELLFKQEEVNDGEGEEGGDDGKEQFKAKAQQLKKKEVETRDFIMHTVQSKSTATKEEVLEAVKQLRPWVQKKKAWAQTCMGCAYRDGRGVKQSYAMAKMLYELAAKQGDGEAMCHLGGMYFHGSGVEQSYEKAFEYYEQAADLGDANSQYNLGRMYCNGHGVEKDAMKGKEWLKKAAAQGHEDAINMLEIINTSETTPTEEAMK